MFVSSVLIFKLFVRAREVGSREAAYLPRRCTCEETQLVEACFWVILLEVKVY